MTRGGLRRLLLSVGLGWTLLGQLAAATELSHVGGWSQIPILERLERPLWEERLAAHSEGALTATLIPVNQLGLEGGEVFRLLARGVFDSGSAVADHVIGDAPALAGLDLPGLAFDIATAQQIAAAYRPVAARILEARFDARLLAIVPYPAQVLFCNDAVSGLDDLNGRRIRVSGRTAADFVGVFGAAGLTLPFAEVPGALERGALDCAVTGTLTGYNAGWHELTDHLLPVPVGGWDYLLTAMRGERWRAIPPELQASLPALIQTEYEDPAWAMMEQLSTDGVHCLTGTGPCPHGMPGHMTLHPVSADTTAKARAALEQHVLPAWADSVCSADIEAWNASVGRVTGLTARRDQP